MENFSETLLHRNIELSNASEVARFSFIAHKSITCLDLELYQECLISNYTGNTCGCCTFELLNNFVNTEEKCRKYFIPSRSLLYNLHLDLPKGREYHLNQGPKDIVYNNYEDIEHLVKLMPNHRFYDEILSNFISEIIEDKSKKLDILKRLLKFTVSGMSYLYYLEIETAKKFFDFFYPTITVPELFKKFIMNLNILEWVTTYEDPEVSEYLLYNARHFGKEYLMEREDDCDTTTMCLLHHLFKNISPILKYMNAPKIFPSDCTYYSLDILSMRPDLDNEEFHEAEKETDETRMCLMLQLVWMFLKGYQRHSDDVTLEVLRLIWCSIPDPFISFQEMRIFEKGLSAKELESVYCFYVRAIGKFYVTIEPRPLQHLCRTVIRRTLRENKSWIPEGISLTGLSTPLQSFLNLEKNRCHL